MSHRSSESPASPRLVMNPAAARSVRYADWDGAVLTVHGADAAWTEITSWPDYAPTPLHSLDTIADQLGVAALWYKDEGHRFSLSSFKALGGAYGVLKELERCILARTPGARVTSGAIRAGGFRSIVDGTTVACATDGNHGRSVAWGAQLFGCHAVIYVPAATSRYRAEAIARYGARVVRIDGSYDDAVRRVDRDAAEHGWRVVSDTSYAGYEMIPLDVMHGYTVVVREVLAQLPPNAHASHVFVQAGVGGFAAAVCAALWETYGSNRPTLIVVEPDAADCCLQRTQRDHTPHLDDVHATVMACLAAEDVSPVVWPTLRAGADAFLAIPDQYATDAMRLLAAQTPPVVAGESGSAGLAGFLAVMGTSEMKSALGLDAGSRVLLFGTEGATDPEIYAGIVGDGALHGV